MTRLYKLTDEHDRTHGGCQWGPDVCVETSGEGPLWDNGWTHWYTHPLVAVLLNPIHGAYDLSSAHLWEGDDGGGEIRNDRGLKIGCTRGTTRRRVPLPKITVEQKIRFGIACAWQVYPDPQWRKWAVNWLTGADRTKRSAYAAATTATAAASFTTAAASFTAAAARFTAAAARSVADAAKDSLPLVALAKWAMTADPIVPEANE